MLCGDMERTEAVMDIWKLSAVELGKKIKEK